MSYTPKKTSFESKDTEKSTNENSPNRDKWLSTIYFAHKEKIESCKENDRNYSFPLQYTISSNATHPALFISLKNSWAQISASSPAR